MLLFVSSLRSSSNYAALLQRGCGERVETLDNFAAAISAVGRRHYSALLIDQEMANADSTGNFNLVDACGTTSIVYLDLTSSAPERILEKVRRAFNTHIEQLAIRRAASKLRNQLRSSVTGILLSSELAMAVPELPAAAHVKIKFVHDIAKGMSRQLET